MSTPARGPQPMTRRDGTTAYSTGLVHTWCIRAADKICSTRTVQDATTPATQPSPATRGDHLYQAALHAADHR